MHACIFYAACMHAYINSVDGTVSQIQSSYQAYGPPFTILLYNALHGLILRILECEQVALHYTHDI